MDVSIEIQREVWLLAAQYCIDNDSLTQAEQFLDTAKTLFSLEQPDSLVLQYWLLQDSMHCTAIFLGPPANTLYAVKKYLS